MLDLHTNEHDYLECNVPLLVNTESMQGTGQLPKFEEDLFATHVAESRRYLIPTAEVSIYRIPVFQRARMRAGILRFPVGVNHGALISRYTITLYWASVTAG